MKLILSLSLAWALLVSAPTPASVRATAPNASVAGSRTDDMRVTAIGHRLAVANVDLCADRQFLPGFVLHDVSQYGAADREAAIRTYGFEAGPGVLALVPGGPAERDGLRLDDILVSVGGASLPRAERLGRDGSFEQMERILAALDQAFADGRAELGIRRGGQTISISIQAAPGCASRFQLIAGRSINARADGRYVQVTTAITSYAANEQELAAVLAHEFAHNVLRHRIRLDAAGIRRGFLGNFGRNARLVRDTEEEADRLGVYLLDRAGYDPEAAVRFWSRLGRRGLNVFGSPTHGSWRRRIEMIQTEIAAIRRARTAGTVPQPGFVRLPFPPLP